ncbi:ABC transporter substrate-binding protein [Caulobacter sp. 602-1]|uniref:substrate-binding periplasmic protein n=1 Tax=Caulobacter sp. 602-1 TaxID=2492472 RepID=UPI001F1826FB|nr:transporter substrate-binding domain-containing protein [Caulobacter sp. 602-1]
MNTQTHPTRRTLMAMSGAALALGACGRKSGAPGALVVGSTATGAPFSFLDLKTNQLTGAMIDIAHAVAAKAGLAIRIQTTTFAALVPSLTARKIDMIAAGILRTPEREKVVAFTDPVYAYGGGVVTAQGQTRPIRALADLKGLSVGAQVGTRFVDQLAQAGVTDVKTYDNLGDILQDLGNGRIAAGYGDAPILAHRLRTTPNAALRLAPDFTPPSREDVCLLVRRDDPALLAKLNAAIGQIKATEIAAILTKWSL